jgi:hypothetical protein
MPSHGAEAHLPISELAQWMRDTTGRPDDGNSGGLTVYEVVRWSSGDTSSPPPERARQHDYLDIRTRPIVPPAEKLGTLTVDDVLRIAEVDKERLYRAAIDAIHSYNYEMVDHTSEERKVHAERIWALHDQILGETVA